MKIHPFWFRKYMYLVDNSVRKVRKLENIIHATFILLKDSSPGPSLFLAKFATSKAAF